MGPDPAVLGQAEAARDWGPDPVVQGQGKWHKALIWHCDTQFASVGLREAGLKEMGP